MCEKWLDLLHYNTDNEMQIHLTGDTYKVYLLLRRKTRINRVLKKEASNLPYNEVIKVSLTPIC